jgi:Tol biopolymer transport system component
MRPTVSLTSGQRLGPYDIVGLLGAGGMGEVYRARDSQLNRDVAIKVLLPSVATDPERLARFRREAQVLASLNHPNIAHIHGLQELPSEGGSHAVALVMELVEGPTLADRLARGPMPYDEALPIAKQIAEALEAAHDQGVIHRDLKPANVKVRPDGAVKVLDFGLAKAFDPAGASEAERMNSPTRSVHGTAAGVILGTAAYMSPEQACGRMVDRRADIWAFGALLFEMLTGARPFDGDTISETLAAVLKMEPSWAALPDDVPETTRRMLRRCLEKDPRRRLQAIGEARVQLEEALAGGGADVAHAVPRIASPRAILIASIASAAAMAAMLTAVFFAMSAWRRPPADSRTVRFTVDLPAGATWMNQLAPDVVLAPDGSRLAFAATAGGVQRLWIRSFDALTAQELPGTEGASAPFWSPEGRSVAFIANGKLKRIDVAGASAPQPIGSDPGMIGGTWSAAGVILMGSRTGVYRVAASGGEPVHVGTAPGSGDAHLWPQFLPNGRHFLYTVSSSDTARRGIFVGSLDSATVTRVLDGDSNAVVAGGHLLFARNATLMAQPFDVDRLAASGEAFRIAEGVVRGLALPHAVFSVSGSGALVYRCTVPDKQQLTWFDRSGRPVRTLGSAAEVRVPMLSLNAEKLAIDRVDPERSTRDAWVIDVARGYETRLTSHPANDFAPLLSPDGRRVMFASDRDGPDASLYMRSSTGDGPEERILVGGAGDMRPQDWSADSKHVLFATRSGLWLLPITGEPRPVQVTPPGGAQEMHPRFSPDGQWIVYHTNESGRPQVYVRPLAAGAEKSRISTGGGWGPVWRANGKEIFYLDPEGTLMAVAVTTGAKVSAGIARPLFSTPLKGRAEASYRLRSTYAVARDGQRFLFAPPAEGGGAASSFTVVLGWDVAVKR